ncbi:HAD family phosphatase [Planctomycetota bacterium]|nr:HAD family phosphatase [Planctomycetota bacterium]
MTIKAILWDMDGTIVDTERLVYDVIVSSFKHVAEIDLPEETWNSLLGQSEQDFFKAMRAKYSLTNEDAMAIHQHFNANYVPMLKSVTPLSGVNDLCRRLAKTHRQAIVTGSTAEQAATVLQTLGIQDCFEFIVASGQYQHGKPHPEPYLMTAEKMGVTPAECLVLEDSPSGIASSKTAGMFTVGVHEGNQGKNDISQADAEIQTLLEFDDAWLS